MEEAIGMEIAGLRIAVSCEAAPVCHEADAAYEPFVSAVSLRPAPADMDVRLEIDNMPDLRGMNRIFESDQAWTLFSDDRQYFLSLNPPATGGAPALIARFNADLREATVHCAGALYAGRGNGTAIANPVRYPLDQLLLMYLLSKRDGMIVHAAGIRIKEKCFIFCGRSGAGKSTISRLLRETGRAADLISDDRVIVRRTDDGFAAFGTPWPGEGGFAMNRGFPLSGIFFLSQSDTNAAQRVEKQRALELLLPVVSIPWFDAGVMTPGLRFCGSLLQEIPSWLLHFTPDEGVLEVLDELVAGGGA